MRTILVIAFIAALVVVAARAQVGPPGTMWRGSTGPGSYNTTGPGGYATGGSGGGGGSIPTPPGNCKGVLDLSVGCPLPMLGVS